MHHAAKTFLELPNAKKRTTCLRLCEHALQVWEKTVGSMQTLDLSLPRDALASAYAGEDLAHVASRYREPLIALQDDDVALPEATLFAYYAIHSAFERYALGRDINEWLIVNQALATSPDPIKLLTDAIGAEG